MINIKRQGRLKVLQKFCCSRTFVALLADFDV